VTGRRRTVVVASGDRLFAESLAAFLGAREGWTATTAEDGVVALAAIGRLRPEALLIVGELPRLDAPALARQAHLRWDRIRVVTVGTESVAEARSLPASADADAVVAALSGSRVSAEHRPADHSAGDVALLRTLTRRELAVFRLLAQGATFRDVGDRLRISPQTVRTHAQNLYSKLGCHSRLELVRLAARHGLLEAVAEPLPSSRSVGAGGRRAPRRR
jgi:DNA-binding NarL/FixJ family response regulator